MQKKTRARKSELEKKKQSCRKIESQGNSRIIVQNTVF